MKMAKNAIVGSFHAERANVAHAGDLAGRDNNERVIVIAPIGEDASAIATLLNERGF